MTRVVDALRGLAPVHPEARLEVSVAGVRPPYEALHSSALFARAQVHAEALGLGRLEGVAVGGGSDGNLTAALGVPTLDGLGAVGGGAHAEGEWVSAAELPRRAALVAALVTDLLRPAGGTAR